MGATCSRGANACASARESMWSSMRPSRRRRRSSASAMLASNRIRAARGCRRSPRGVRLCARRPPRARRGRSFGRPVDRRAAGPAAGGFARDAAGRPTTATARRARRARPRCRGRGSDGRCERDGPRRAPRGALRARARRRSGDHSGRRRPPARRPVPATPARDSETRAAARPAPAPRWRTTAAAGTAQSPEATTTLRARHSPRSVRTWKPPPARSTAVAVVRS